MFSLNCAETMGLNNIKFISNEDMGLPLSTFMSSDLWELQQQPTCAMSDNKLNVFQVERFPSDTDNPIRGMQPLLHM